MAPALKPSRFGCSDHGKSQGWGGLRDVPDTLPRCSDGQDADTGVAHLLPACGKGTTSIPVTHSIPKAAPWYSLSPAPAHAWEQRGLLGCEEWAFAGIPHSGAEIPGPRLPCELPLLPPFQLGSTAPCLGLFLGHPSPPGTPPAFPKACSGGRGGEQAGQGNHLAQWFTVRNRPVVLEKAWMWLQASPGKLARCPLLWITAAEHGHAGARPMPEHPSPPWAPKPSQVLLR